MNEKLNLSGYHPVPLRYNKANHFVLDVTINGKKSNMLLDTGANFTNISLKDVKPFGLVISKVSTCSVSGIGDEVEIGCIKGVTDFELAGETFKLSHIHALDITHIKDSYASVNVKTIHGIIGMDLLKKYKGVIDTECNVLWLRLLDNTRSGGGGKVGCRRCVR